MFTGHVLKVASCSVFCVGSCNLKVIKDLSVLPILSDLVRTSYMQACHWALHPRPESMDVSFNSISLILEVKCSNMNKMRRLLLVSVCLLVFHSISNSYHHVIRRYIEKIGSHSISSNRILTSLDDSEYGWVLPSEYLP